jgi:hypothetical protein
VSAAVAATVALGPTKPAAGVEREKAVGAFVSTLATAPLV